MAVACLNCGEPYPDSGMPHQCPRCGGLFDYTEPLTYGGIDAKKLGVWKYGSSFGFQSVSVSLGEGNTPLVNARTFGREVYFKCEFANPSGSFKDSGMATLVAALRARGD